MTIAAFTQTPAYVIQGTGPYQISHPYAEGAIVAQVLIDSVPVELDMSAITVVPISSLTQGNLYLSAEQASRYAGLTLWIDRDTAALQGWEARYGDREVGMETQLDRDTMSLQELRLSIGASLRGRAPMAPYLPEAGRVPIVRGDGQGWENGPSASAIESAQSAAYLAVVGTGTGFDTPDDLAASDVGYGSNTVSYGNETFTVTVSAGDLWVTKTSGPYVVLEPDAVTWDVYTVGGVKLNLCKFGDLGIVVAYGSSTFASNGTTGHVEPGANDWIGGPNGVIAQLKSRWGDRALVVNRSQSGRSTFDMLNNFANEVSPYRPNYVIGATGWVNEPGVTNSEKAANYVYNNIKLKSMCEAIGAKYAIAAFNPTNVNNSTNQYDVKRALGIAGIPIWDLSAGISKNDYTFLDGYFTDGYHANDAGAKIYTGTINDTLLYQAFPARTEWDRENRLAVLQQNADSYGVVKAYMTDADQPPNWTILFEAFNSWTGTEGSFRICDMLLTGAGSDFYMYIDERSGSLTLYKYVAGVETQVFASSRSFTEGTRPIQSAVTYNTVTGVMMWMLDGQIVWTGSPGIPSGYKLSTSILGGQDNTVGLGARGIAFADFRIWAKNFLNDGSFTRLYQYRSHPTESLIVDADFTRPYNSIIGNLAGVPIRLFAPRTSGTFVDRWSGNGPNGTWRINPANWSLQCDVTYNLGALTSYGAGTYDDPYRTRSADNIVFPMSFSSTPLLTPCVRINSTSVDTAARRIFPIVGGWNLVNAYGVQAMRIGSNADTTAAVFRAEISGSFR